MSIEQKKTEVVDMTEKEIYVAEEYVRSNDIESVAEKMLFVLGFKSNLLGTRYLADAIVLRYNGVAPFFRMYQQIAEKYDTTSVRVERAIRHSIATCHSMGNLERINELYKCDVVDTAYPPTNSEFVSTMCTWIHLEKSEKRKEPKR